MPLHCSERIPYNVKKIKQQGRHKDAASETGEAEKNGNLTKRQGGLGPGACSQGPSCIQLGVAVQIEDAPMRAQEINRVWRVLLEPRAATPCPPNLAITSSYRSTRCACLII